MEFGQEELVKDQYSDTREEDQDQEQEDNDVHVDQNHQVMRNTSMMVRSLPFSLYAPSSSSSSSPHQQRWPQLKDYLSQKPGFNPGAVEPSVADSEAGPREHMFDKVVTPSDVGKLNRLVIPKQHAERFFPLDSAANEKGLLLSFEDRAGKLWRFRYSYWNSSQSYVMTKGWSRFVKEKSLDAGDIVSFERNAAGDRLFIDWRRRRHHLQLQHYHHFHPYHQILHSLPMPISVPIAPPRNYETLLYNYHDSGGVPYQQQQHQYRHQYQHHNNIPQDFMSYHQFSTAPPPAATTPRRLRLFGVNMECRPADDQVETRVSSSVQYPDLQVRIPTNSSSILPLPLPRPSSFQAEFSQFMGTSSNNSLSFNLDP